MNLLNFIFKPAKRIETELTVSRMEALRRAASRAQPPDQIIGGTITSSENGWSLEIPPSTGGGATVRQPHEVISVEEEKIKIQNGTVNNLITLPIAEIPHTKTDDYKYLIIEISIDSDNGVQGAEYKILDDAPDAIEWGEDDVPDTIELLIAIIQGSTIHQITTGNKFVQRIVAHQIPKDVVSVGEYPNEIYYTYRVT